MSTKKMVNAIRAAPAIRVNILHGVGSDLNGIRANRPLETNTMKK